MSKCDWNVAFFNIEVSSCRTALAIHANEEGISKFLDEYGRLPEPPEVIFLSKISRPQRRWNSWKIKENENLVLEDPTPYCATHRVLVLNIPAPVLRIKFVEERTETILCAGISKETPTLTVNKEGWQKFLSALRCLRDDTYWFYITIVNDGWEHLPFQLTSPYRGLPEDKPFLGIEFIRTTPEERMSLILSLDYNEFETYKDTRTQEEIDTHIFSSILYFGGNALGLLTFSKWIKEFVESSKIEKSFINKWVQPIHEQNEPLLDEKHIVLKKVQEKSSKPIFSFEFLKGLPHHLYIFANDEGFYYFADHLEKYAFSSDYDFTTYDYNRRTITDPKDNYIAYSNYRIHGGGYFYPKYNPLLTVQSNTNLSPEDARFQTYLICRNFINERVILKYDDNPTSN